MKNKELFHHDYIDDDEEDKIDPNGENSVASNDSNSLNKSVWIPCVEGYQFNLEKLESEPIEIDLLQICDKEVYVRKSTVKDFRRSVENCKPTVLPTFIELYARFLEKYGHKD